MKEEKRVLFLNKRTIANLNNLEMTHVRGGDGEGGGVSNGYCDEKEKGTVSSKPNDDVLTIAKTITTMLQTKFFC